MFGCYVSYVNFQVANPIAVTIGLCKVILTDAEYAVVREEPKMVFVKPNYTLTEYMEKLGYEEDKEKRDFATHTFVNGNAEVTIHRSYNNVYGMWHWQE